MWLFLPKLWPEKRHVLLPHNVERLLKSNESSKINVLSGSQGCPKLEMKGKIPLPSAARKMFDAEKFEKNGNLGFGDNPIYPISDPDGQNQDI